MVAYPDRGAGNDPKLFFFFFFLWEGGGGGSLSPPRLNIFTVGNMGVLICLGQGGLRSLSASSYYYYLLGKGGYVFGSVDLFVCLSVCGQHYSKSYERIEMKFYEGVLGSTVKN